MNSDHDDEKEIFPFQSSGQIIEANPSAVFDRVLNQGMAFKHSVDCDGNKVTHAVIRVYQDGVLVGRASFHSPPATYFYCTDVEVEPAHRRKGIASAMYVLAEKLFQKPVGQYHGRRGLQSELGNLLWANPNRPFGN